MTKAAARRMATACGEVMILARRLEGQFAHEIAEARVADRLMERVVRGWREVVARSGPARIAALAEVRRAREAVGVLVEEETAAGASWRAGARRRMQTAARKELAVVEEQWAPMGEAACLAWALVRRVRM